MTETEFLSFLYAEKERLHTNFSKPGWSNWAIGGAFIALIVYIFNILITPNLLVNWEVVLMLFIGFFSITIILIMIYPILFPKIEIYYPSRITTLWEESPIFELIISGLSFLIITILLIICCNYSWILYVFGYLSIERLITVCRLFCKRNKLVSSGTKYNASKLLFSNTKYHFVFTKLITMILNIISFGLFVSIFVYSSCGYLQDFNLYQNELQIVAFFLGIWVLTYIFFKTNSTPNKMLNGIDNIIDRYAYSDISQQDAMDELMYLRYGSNVNQIIKNDKTVFFTALTKLEYINTQLDIVIKDINAGKLNPQFYYEWLVFQKNERPKLIDAISKGEKFIAKLDSINNIPNNANHSDDFKLLMDLIKSGINKIRTTQDNFSTVSKKMAIFRETYYCRKSGLFCGDLDCKKRNDKMSIKYALEKFPIKNALYLIMFRKR